MRNAECGVRSCSYPSCCSWMNKDTRLPYSALRIPHSSRLAGELPGAGGRQQGAGVGQRQGLEVELVDQDVFRAEGPPAAGERVRDDGLDRHLVMDAADQRQVDR